MFSSYKRLRRASGEGSSNPCGEGSSNPSSEGGSHSQEPMPDFVRDMERDEELREEGDDRRDACAADPYHIPPQRIFIDLERPMPRLPTPDPFRAKKVNPITDPTKVTDRNFCSFRFISHNAHITYLTDSKLKRKGTPEKKFPETGMMSDGLREVIKNERMADWFKLVKGKTSASLVREILANLRHWNERESSDSRIIYCRGKFFELTPASIRRALGFPPLTEPCAYQTQLEKESNLESVSKYIFGYEVERWERRPEMPRWKVNKNFVGPEARWMCELLENWVLGIAAQPIYTFKLCTLAFCAASGRRVDLPWFIYESLMERKSRECEKGPGHGYLLQAIVKKAGCNLQGILYDVDQPPSRKLENVSRASHKASERPPRRARAAPTQEPEAGSSSGTPAELMAAMAEMRGMMIADRVERDRQFAHIRANQRQLGYLIERNGQWQLANYQGTPDPPPPISSPWYDSDEYEYPIYEQAEGAGDDDDE